MLFIQPADCLVYLERFPLVQLITSHAANLAYFFIETMSQACRLVSAVPRSHYQFPAPSNTLSSIHNFVFQIIHQKREKKKEKEKNKYKFKLSAFHFSRRATQTLNARLSISSRFNQKVTCSNLSNVGNFDDGEDKAVNCNERGGCQGYPGNGRTDITNMGNTGSTHKISAQDKYVSALCCRTSLPTRQTLMNRLD